MNVTTPPTLDDLENQYPPRALPAGTEVTRVAPSPTGKPHIGTALQATIDLAFARKTGGVFILRIEDTDRNRLVDEAVEEIVAALDWLGLHPDEGPGVGGAYGPYVESERLDVYSVVVEKMVSDGTAYPCFCSPEWLAELREAQRAAGQPTRYDRRCRGLPLEERNRRLGVGEEHVVRLAMPLAGIIGFEDAVRGRIEFDAADQDDPVLMKSDGYPTYHLAAIVDDHFMRVTLVVRGEEWVSSTPKHVVLQRALGWEPLPIVHTPLLRDEQGRKQSKRSGDTSISWFRSQGYLPEAFRNFLTRIIWTHPENLDVYPFEDFIARIEPGALPKTGPIVNLSLLDHICSGYIRQLDPAALYNRVVSWLEWLLGQMEEEVIFQVARKGTREPHPVKRDTLHRFRAIFTADRSYTERVLALEPERYSTLADVVLQNPFYFPKLFSPPAVASLLKQTKGDTELATRILREYLDGHDGALPESEWQGTVYALATRLGVKTGMPFMLLRLAMTGTDRSPPLYPIMQIIGEAEVRRRVEASLRGVASSCPDKTSG